MNRNGKPAPTVILTPPRRFYIDMDSYINAVRAADNIDYSQRTRLYDLYTDILEDGHLDSVRDKRIAAARSIQIEFRRDDKPVEEINDMLRSPWFYNFIGDLMDSIFWGFSLFQFYLDDNGWVNYTLVPRKHVDPVNKLILRRQSDIQGIPWDSFRDLLFVGSERGLGKLAKAAPYVIYKRNDMADWAQFAEIFGMPIREYIYDAEDDEVRKQIMNDMREQGAAAAFMHPRDSELKLIESGGKAGSSDLYDKLYERCNNEISKIFLGNTLTTEAGDKGTQALGTVQMKGEEKINDSDRQFILNVLNYDMTDIFNSLGYNTAGGKFVYVEPKETSTSVLIDQIQKVRAMGTPISDDDVYNLTGLPKPVNYEELKNVQRTAAPAVRKDDDNRDDDPDSNDTPEGEDTPKNLLKTIYSRLKGFFAKAPVLKNGALKW